MLRIRCKNCNKELESHPTQARCCGCSNMTQIIGDRITAVDLSKTMIVKMRVDDKEKDEFTSQDLQWQEERRKRKVRRLDYEVR
tara:strand:+ start:119 stop:370 length:252 start_codon:yes stop_codon:yes gene_type:complete